MVPLKGLWYTEIWEVSSWHVAQVLQDGGKLIDGKGMITDECGGGEVGG